MELDPLIQGILNRLGKRISDLELDNAYLETRAELMAQRIDELESKEEDNSEAE